MPFIEIERKTDILALSSFLLSVIAIGYQLSGYLTGARMQLFPPSEVVLSEYDYGAKGKPNRYLALEAVMTYANKGQLGYNDVIKSETVSFIGPSGKRVTLHWQDFLEGSTSDPNNPDKKIYSAIKPAGPQVVAARDAISHETRFVANNSECDEETDKDCPPSSFLPVDLTLFDYLAKNNTIEFEFSAETYGDDKRLVSGCHILPQQIEMESYKRRQWVALNCYSTNK